MRLPVSIFLAFSFLFIAFVNHYAIGLRDYYTCRNSVCPAGFFTQSINHSFSFVVALTYARFAIVGFQCIVETLCRVYKVKNGLAKLATSGLAVSGAALAGLQAGGVFSNAYLTHSTDNTGKLVIFTIFDLVYNTTVSWALMI